VQHVDVSVACRQLPERRSWEHLRVYPQVLTARSQRTRVCIWGASAQAEQAYGRWARASLPRV
jgi:hypothetical protein